MPQDATARHRMPSIRPPLGSTPPPINEHFGPKGDHIRWVCEHLGLQAPIRAPRASQSTPGAPNPPSLGSSPQMDKHSDAKGNRIRLVCVHLGLQAPIRAPRASKSAPRDQNSPIPLDLHPSLQESNDRLGVGGRGEAYK